MEALSYLYAVHITHIDSASAEELRVSYPAGHAG